MSRKTIYADREPSIAELLSDPIAEALMLADGISVADVLVWIGRRRGEGPSPPPAPQAAGKHLVALPAQARFQHRPISIRRADGNLPRGASDIGASRVAAMMIANGR